MEWEDVSPLYMYNIYIYIFVGRDTDVTVNEEEDTSKKLIKKFWFAKECQRDVVQTLMWFEKHMDEIVSRHHENDFFTQSWYPNDEKQQNYVSFKESVVDDSWRSDDFEMSQNDPISTMYHYDYQRNVSFPVFLL